MTGAREWLSRGVEAAQSFRFGEARDCLVRAVEQGAPPYTLALLAAVRSEEGDDEGAARDLDEALRLDPGNPVLQLSAAVLLPMFYESATDLERWRSRYRTRLAAFVESGRRASARDAELLGWPRTNFRLAYQGQDDRELQVLLSKGIALRIRRALPAHAHPVPRIPYRARRRVAVVSAYLYDCTVGRYFESWISGLSRAGLETVVFATGAVRDETTARIAAVASRFVEAAVPVPDVAALVAGASPDVLIYPEVGMDPHTRLLACLHLAPVQLAAWGHPVTTGSDAIDGFVTCGEMEPDDADAHYEEPLVRLPGIGVDYAPSPAPKPFRREDLRLHDAERLYFCPHSLFKLHPDADAMFAALLRSDPGGVLVLFQGQSTAPDASRRLGQRIARSLEANGVAPGRQIRIMPRMSPEAFRSVLPLADVVIDPPHWSGGNTALDALALAVPVVAVPGRFMRSRQSMAMLDRLGLPELVASGPEDAARIARDVAADRDRRARLSRAIATNRARVFGDGEAVGALVERVTELASSGPPRLGRG